MHARRLHRLLQPLRIHRYAEKWGTLYHAAHVESLFNADSGCNFDLAAELPIDNGDWKLGLVVGPSGSEKTSIGCTIFGGDAFYQPEWPDPAHSGASLIGVCVVFDLFEQTKDQETRLAAYGLGE